MACQIDFEPASPLLKEQVMDASISALVNASTQMQQTQVAQSAQILVLKKAMDLQAAGALALLQALPGNLPLASSGNLGTQVNAMA
ncbi:MAG: putative motility protein [Rhodoferax sp.]|jgi:hypothetical protein|nr:putative motility protein [Rhodoferax sp.]